MELLTPKYITKEVCQQAVEAALSLTMVKGGVLYNKLKRHQCHIVVLVPAMADARADDYPDWPDYPTRAELIYEQSVGKDRGWGHKYDSIARCKALQLWTGRNDDRTGPIPHLLFSGDTQYWGGVFRRGFVVTCSGVQPHFDKMISGVTSDGIVALAYDAFVKDPEVQSGADFLS